VGSRPARGSDLTHADEVEPERAEPERAPALAASAPIIVLALGLPRAVTLGLGAVIGGLVTVPAPGS
jgi:hypothetical protein